MRAALLALLLSAALPATAAAHGEIRIAGGELVYLSEDSASASQLEITGDPLQIRIYDPGAIGGIQAPPACKEGQVDGSGLVVEWTCPATGVIRIGAEVGPSEDAAVVRSGFPVRLHGDSGADGLRTGEGSDVLRGRDGNDRLFSEGGHDLLEPGAGADVVSAGPGDDDVHAADGERDSVSCGPDRDQVSADQFDVIDADCEEVLRERVEPPLAPAEGDTAAPSLRVSGAARQRAGRVRLRARSAEAGDVSVSAILAVGGLNLRVPVVTRRLEAGRTRTIALQLSRSQVRRVRRARRARLVVTVVASDRAGNATRPRSLRIRLTP